MKPQQRPENSLQNYEIIQVIASGTFGEVLEAYDKKNKDHVALKKFFPNIEQGPGLQGTSIREIGLLKAMNHENIIKLRGVITDKPELYVVLELMKTDLRNCLSQHKNQLLSENIVKKYLHQILKATAYFHKKYILHRDLKPENILIDQKNNLRIADFGLGRKIFLPPRPYTLSVVTLHYRAPEILLGYSLYTNKIDIWSIGCIFAEMITGRVFFPSSGDIDQLQSIFRKMGTPNEKSWPGWSDMLKTFKQVHRLNFDFGQYRSCPLQKQISEDRIDANGIDLLKKMLICDPGQRISAKQALNHPYFNDLISN